MLKNYVLSSNSHRLGGLFRLGSRLFRLSRRRRIVYCTVSFESIRRNLGITSFSFPPVIVKSMADGCMLLSRHPTDSHMNRLLPIKPHREAAAPFKLYYVRVSVLFRPNTAVRKIRGALWHLAVFSSLPWVPRLGSRRESMPRVARPAGHG